jgi:sedoheptulokinase
MGPYAAGIDLGTTNLELILADLGKRCIAEQYSAPVRRIAGGNPYAFEQDAAGIVASVRELLGKVKAPVCSVGITGQVHGIVYTDEALKPLSPLYSWLDRRGAEPWKNTTPRAVLEEKTGFLLPAGYGLLTHYANRLFGRVPAAARRLMGITELVAGTLTGAPLSETDDSILASFGGWEPAGAYRETLLAEALSPACPAFLGAAPHFSLAGRLAGGLCPGGANAAGSGSGGVPVAYPVGDNQAGFFGALPRPEESCLISIGTSGQISLFSGSAVCPPGMELRPYLGKGYLQVGATLAAGKTYEALASLVGEIIRASGAKIGGEAVFALMKQAAQEAGETSLVFETTLNGTRPDAAKRGAITGISPDNLKLGSLVLSAIDGIVRELADFTKQSGVSFGAVKRITITGNAPRKNSLFRESARRQFGREIRMPAFDGAGLGAAIIGAIAAGVIGEGESAGIIEQFQEYGTRGAV